MKNSHLWQIMGIALCLGIFCSAKENVSGWTNDPSLTQSDENSPRLRIRADFNNDGIMDVALSVPLSLFGNGGGDFNLYLRDKQGKYKRVGEFMASPHSIALEFRGETVRIWAYGHISGSEGVIGYNEIKQNSMSPFKGITIFPGDGGTPMGNAIYMAVMKNSEAPLFVEQSFIQDGKVKWKKY